jgi:uncharacterized RmlC-like cupin family protein
MNRHDEFHTDLTAMTEKAAHRSLRTRVHHVTVGMARSAALTGGSVGSEKIWKGETQVAPSTVSGNHHHGESETAIYVRSGHPEFVFHDGREELRVATAPGDYVFVPPYVPHREENPDSDDPAVIVIARSTQEAIVINLAELYLLSHPAVNQG